jgi:hypothetical protein
MFRGGVNWNEELRQSLLSAEVLLVLIGPEWQTMTGDRGRRIDDPADYVHLEVKTALEYDLRIIPVLLDGAQTPLPRTLPPRLEGLVRRRALRSATRRSTTTCRHFSQVSTFFLTRCCAADDWGGG